MGLKGVPGDITFSFSSSNAESPVPMLFLTDVYLTHS